MFVHLSRSPPHLATAAPATIIIESTVKDLVRGKANEKIIQARELMFKVLFDPKHSTEVCSQVGHAKRWERRRKEKLLLRVEVPGLIERLKVVRIVEFGRCREKASFCRMSEARYHLRLPERCKKVEVIRLVGCQWMSCAWASKRCG